MKVVPKRFGDLKAGDRIIGADGSVVEVNTAYDEHIPETMFEVGSGDKSIQVSGNHLWYVETDFDRQMHKTRVRQASKILKKALDAEAYDCFAQIENMDEPVVKTSLSDMIGFCDADENRDVFNILARVALSLGPIEEEYTQQVDIETDAVVSNVGARIYDARKFVQQLRALSENRHRDVLIGQVVTTERMAMLMPLGVNIPDLPEQKISASS